MESRQATATFHLDKDELKELTEDLGRSCRYAHDALISDLHIFNRYIAKEHIEEIERRYG